MSRKKWYVVIAVVVVGAFGITLYWSNHAKTVEKEQQLMSELQQLRAAVQAYVTINKKKPESIEEAFGALYELSQRGVENVNKDDQGNRLDPFGNPYTYDAESGWVKSTSQDYAGW